MPQMDELLCWNTETGKLELLPVICLTCRVLVCVSAGLLLGYELTLMDCS